MLAMTLPANLDLLGADDRIVAASAAYLLAPVSALSLAPVQMKVSTAAFMADTNPAFVSYTETHLREVSAKPW